MLRTYFSTSFSQLAKPRFFRFFIVVALKLSDLPEVKVEWGALGKVVSNICHSLNILTILVAEHVVSNVAYTGLWNHGPVTDVVSFDG